MAAGSLLRILQQRRFFEISEQFQIEVDDLRAPLDEEERSRIEVEDDYTLILVDVPMIEERNDKDWYGTILSVL